MILSFFVPLLRLLPLHTTHTNTRVTCFLEGQLKSGDIHSLVFTAIFLWRREGPKPSQLRESGEREGGGAADPAKSELDGRGLRALRPPRARPFLFSAMQRVWPGIVCSCRESNERKDTEIKIVFSSSLSPSRVNARERTPGYGCGLFVQSTR